MTDISSLTNTRVVLKSRPVGMPTDDNFEIQSVPVAPPGEGEMLLRTLWLSLDPYMRGRMSDRKSYAKPLDIGDVITGGVVCQVVASNIDDFPVGTIVSGMYGWQSYAIARADDNRLFRIDPDLAPISTAVGVTGSGDRGAGCRATASSQAQGIFRHAPGVLAGYCGGGTAPDAP